MHRQVCREQEGEEDRRYGNTTSTNEQKWGLDTLEGSGRYGKVERYCCSPDYRQA